LLLLIVVVTNYCFANLFILNLHDQTKQIFVLLVRLIRRLVVRGLLRGGANIMLGARRDLLAQLGYRPLLLPKLRRQPFVSICQTLASAFEIIMVRLKVVPGCF
jgi:hypothetical protein